MRLLITGGSGYLGSHLIAAARDPFELFATYYSRPIPDGVPLDVRDADSVRRLFDSLRPDCVIHTAYDKSSDGWQAVIGDGSANVAQAARQVGARLIHLSTDVVFSGARGWYCEDDPPDPITDYGRVKAEAEQRVAACLPDALLVRTSLIYGTLRDAADANSRFVLDGLLGHTPVTLFQDEFRCPICVTDLAAALLELVTLPFDRLMVRGPLHVAGAERVSRYQFGVLLARYHGHDPRPLQATTSEAAGLIRPKDCTLDTTRAQALLRTRLRGVGEVLR
ncbi:MAG: SDR family oxidoreductase [Chloroflexi bacterium]|nr:SDR family oxidoreductase [Chloroflexota bacterium]